MIMFNETYAGTEKGYNEYGYRIFISPDIDDIETKLKFFQDFGHNIVTDVEKDDPTMILGPSPWHKGALICVFPHDNKIVYFTSWDNLVYRMFPH